MVVGIRSLIIFYCLTGVPASRWLLWDGSRVNGQSQCQYSQNSVVDDEQEEGQRFIDEETVYENNIRENILNAALGFVPEKGWTKEALAMGKGENICTSPTSVL